MSTQRRTEYDLGHLYSWEGCFHFSVLSSLQAYNSLTGSAYGMLYLVRRKRHIKSISPEVGVSKWVDFPGVMLEVLDPTGLIGAGFLSSGRAWLVFLPLSAQWHLSQEAWRWWVCSLSPQYPPWIDHCLWTLDPQRYPGENPCFFIPYSLPEVSAKLGICLIGL